MKLTGFDYDVIALVTMSGHEVLHLMGLADRHYDRKCKAAGEQGGFLYGFMNHWSLGDQSLDDEIELSMTGHELGTLGKISETDLSTKYCEQFLVILGSRTIEYHRLKGGSMSLPKFTTEIVDLVSKSDVDVVFDNFTLQISKEDLFLGAEWYMRERIPNSSVYSFRDMPGGLMMRVLGMTVMAVLESENGGLSLELNVRLMEHYGFDSESMPPRLLAREAVALQVRLSIVTSDLGRELGRKVDRASVQGVGDGFITPTEVYTTTDDEIDAIMTDL